MDIFHWLAIVFAFCSAGLLYVAVKEQKWKSRIVPIFFACGCVAYATICLCV